MSRILLLSSGLEAIKDFVGRPPETIKMIFVPTAGNPDEDGWWIDKDREVLAQMGFRYTELDIAGKSAGELSEALRDIDLVYIAGGYTYYLLEQIRSTGFDTVLTDFVRRGGMYVGASAGALIAGPDIEPCSRLDGPEYGPDLKSTKGLGFVPIVPMPHYNMSTRSEMIKAITESYKDRYEIVPITDDEAIVSDRTTWQKVKSKRSELERKWLDAPH